jgi:hypothetical protein
MEQIGVGDPVPRQQSKRLGLSGIGDSELDLVEPFFGSRWFFS